MGRRFATIHLAAVLAVVVPVLLVLGLLLPVVDRDPVVGVTGSNSPFTDEGWNVLTARNLAVLGRPITDDWVLGLVTLPFTAVAAATFGLFGVGIVQARLVDVVSVALTVGLLGGCLQRPFGRGAAFVAAVAYGTSTLILFYGRMAYLEPLVALFLTAGTLMILSVDGTHPGRWGIVAGIAFALAIGTKTSAVPGVAALLLVAALFAVRVPVARSWVVGATVALVTLVAAWFVLVWAPNRDAISRLVHQVYPPAPLENLRALARRAITYVAGGNDHALAYLAPLEIAAIGGLVAAWGERRSASLGSRALIAGSAAAFVVGFAAVVLGIGSANRYVVIVIPWLAILTAPLTSAVARKTAATARSRRAATDGRVAARVAVVGLAILLAAQGVLLHASWMSNATDNLVGIQAAAARLLPAGSVVAGGYAPLLAMRAPVETIVDCCGRNPVNGGDLYSNAGARYWANPTAPKWAGSHQAAWDRRMPVVCLPWTYVSVTTCIEQIP